MKNYLILAVALFCATGLFAQTSQNWSAEFGKSRSFIQNQGQFDHYENSETGPIAFAVDFGATKVFFGKKGVSFNFLEAEKKSRKEREEILKMPSQTVSDHKQKEKLYGKFLFRSDVVNMTWIASNDAVVLEGTGKQSDYHSYAVSGNNGAMNNFNFVPAYDKITYKNIYPGIDIEYTIHPEIGVKYAYVLNPGANPNLIQARYDRDIALFQNKVHVATLFGDIIDHEPLTFYENNREHIIGSRYAVNDRIVSFSLDNYDNTQRVVIDPWVQTPSFATNWDCVWECERDALGNVYIIGGIMPLQLLKYSPAGALQWTYSTPYDTSNCWLGTFATDLNGNSYVTRGSVSGMQKIATNGTLTWTNAGGGGAIGNSDEYWNIAFNCDQSSLIVGGTAGAFALPPLLEAAIFTINTTNGNYTNVTEVAVGPSAAFPPIQVQEVRSISAAPNGKYYWLTQDTIGFINDDPNFCSNSPISFFKTDHGADFGYKSENYRYDNTGIMAIRADENAVYMHRGNQLQKRSLVDLSLISSVAIPNGGYNAVFLSGNQVSNSGIDIDDCGNIYVGSTNGVYKFTSALVQDAFYSTSFVVYDVTVSTSGDIIACGGTGTSASASRSGGVQSFAASACAPMTASCCDPSFCVPSTICDSDAAFNFSSASPGGTWSGPGITAGGLFDPSLTGPGTFDITYTLVCGTETLSINVIPCGIEVCEETNGTLSASGGTAPYTWYTGTIIPASAITNEAQCIACPSATPQYIGFPPFAIYTGCSINTCPQDTSWTQYAVGNNTAAPASYPIQILDANGTPFIISSAASIPDCSANPCAGVSISVTVSAQTNVDCFGTNTGSATVSASGGTGPYTYLWNPGNLSGATQNALGAATYNIIATDDNGCEGNGTVTITQPSQLNASATATNANCGSNNGTATASATGGTGSYDYLWSPSGGTNANATGLAPGTYTVTVSDQNGCSDDATVSVGTLNGPAITVANFDDISCFGANDGSATVSASGGTPGYTYSWTPGGLSGATQNGLQPGVYTVTVTDNIGCTDQIDIDFTEPAEIVLSASTTQANCGVSDGSASISVTGGVGGLTYVWSPNVSSGNSANGIAAGLYSVVVTDGNGCSSTVNFTITTIGGPTLTPQSTTNVSCFGGNDGQAVVDVTGGTAPYTYAWSPSGGNAATANNLTAGSYTVTVTDDVGCVSVESFTITEPNQILITENVTNENCGQSDGAISISVSGGTPTYSYLWSPGGETTSAISNLSFGTYSVTVTDNEGCSVTQNYDVIPVGTIPVNATPSSATIVAGESVQLTATGAVNYVWTPSAGLSCSTCPDPVASPTVTTSYIVTGTDDSGCSGADTVTIFVTIDCADIFVPTIFSPNGIGPSANEYLCVFGNCISQMSFKIYNRWGELVFETETASNGTDMSNEICWDGTHRGKPVQTGAYVYTIYAEMFNGDIVETSGNITVVR